MPLQLELSSPLSDWSFRLCKVRWVSEVLSPKTQFFSVLQYSKPFWHLGQVDRVNADSFSTLHSQRPMDHMDTKVWQTHFLVNLNLPLHWSGWSDWKVSLISPGFGSRDWSELKEAETKLDQEGFVCRVCGRRSSVRSGVLSGLWCSRQTSHSVSCHYQSSQQSKSSSRFRRGNLSGL